MIVKINADMHSKVCALATLAVVVVVVVDAFVVAFVVVVVIKGGGTTDPDVQYENQDVPLL